MARSRKIDWERVAKTRMHPLQISILKTLAKGRNSPSKIAEELGEPIGNVSYHCRYLFDLGLTVQVGTRPVRGTLEHFYELA